MNIETLDHSMIDLHDHVFKNGILEKEENPLRQN